MLRSQINCSLCSRSSLAKCCLRRTTYAHSRHLPITCIARSLSTFGRHCLRRNTHTDRCHLPIAHVARSFNTLRRPHSFHLHRISFTQKGIICPLLPLLTHSALLAGPAHFTRTESQMHTRRQAPSPHRSHCSLNTNTRRQAPSPMPIARVARSFSALGRPHSFHSH